MKNLKDLLKDFIRSGDNGSLKMPSIKENIEWLITNCSNDPKHLEEFFTSTHDNPYRYSSDIIKILKNKKFILKRMEDLVEKGFVFSDEGNSLIRFGEIGAFKLALKNGLDINAVNSAQNYPLRNSILRRKPKITEILWNLPGINKDLIDDHGSNIVHVAAEKKIIYILVDEFKDSPEKFSQKNKFNKTPFDELIRCNWNDITEEKLNKIKPILLTLIDECERLANFNEVENVTDEMLENRTRFENIQKNLLLKELVIINNYNKLNNNLSKNNDSIKKAVIKI